MIEKFALLVQHTQRCALTCESSAAPLLHVNLHPPPPLPYKTQVVTHPPLSKRGRDPALDGPTKPSGRRSCGVDHVVALHVAFERHTLKPVFHLIGYRLWL
jgi:hypothetical protein